MADAKAANELMPSDEANYKAKLEEIYGDKKRFDALASYDFPEVTGAAELTDPFKRYIVEYDEPDISMDEISGSKGTKVRPNPDPKKDPRPPTPKE